ncbi:MAG: DegT/DnrJ/EryC1/StrS family aminotransferase [Alphaproteobacteria bacterium]|uniref:DegT/DnrJ/EryC1/StrS family aminotransferase n=1 Tax=Roseibium sp. TaxID=1936156 RepID=UPI003294A022
MTYKKLTSYVIENVLPDFDLNELVQPPLEDPKVRFRNLAIDDPVLRARLLDAVDDALRNGQLVMGAQVEQLEHRIASYCGVPHCVGVGSGTSAVYITLASLNVGQGDEVITTPLTAVAATNAISATGATPVFVDIGEDLNFDADLIEGAISPRTKAILAVHNTGRICDMEKIMAIAADRGLWVVEDASQAWGAECALGRAGSLGHAAAISISQMKILNSYGEAGVTLTRDPDLAREMVLRRSSGLVNREVCLEPHLNHKIDTIQAAMTLASFDEAENKIRRRLEIARSYYDALADVVACPEPPADINDRRSVFFDFTISTPERKALRRWMEDKGVEVKVRHPLTIADQPCYRGLPTRRPLPVASRLVGEILSLPIHERLSDNDVGYVIECILDFFPKQKTPTPK